MYIKTIILEIMKVLRIIKPFYSFIYLVIYLFIYLFRGCWVHVCGCWVQSLRLRLGACLTVGSLPASR